jgi:thioredoxin 1
LLQVDKQTFDTEVLQAPGLVVVDFWSPKCEKCEELCRRWTRWPANTRGGPSSSNWNAASNRRLSISQQVLGLPAIGFYRDGQNWIHWPGR